MLHSYWLRHSMLLIVFMGFFNLTMGQMKTDSEEISAFHRAYNSASARERRNLVIKAIDDEMLKQGKTTFEDAQNLFGDHLVLLGKKPMLNDKGKKVAEVLRAVVFFQPAIQSPDPFESAYQTGWYVDLVFLCNRLENYSLSNVHKASVD